MSSSKKDEQAFLDPSKSSKWVRLDSDSIVLKGLGTAVEHEANRVIVRQGEMPGAVCLIHSGIVKLHLAANIQNECTFGLRSRGWWAGSTSILVGVSSLYQVTALTTCSVSSIPAEDFRKELEETPELLRQFLLLHCEELLSLQQFMVMQENMGTARLQTLWNQAKT